jgi:hypothetical protein
MKGSLLYISVVGQFDFCVIPEGAEIRIANKRLRNPLKNGRKCLSTIYQGDSFRRGGLFAFGSSAPFGKTLKLSRLYLRSDELMRSQLIY